MRLISAVCVSWPLENHVSWFETYVRKKWSTLEKRFQGRGRMNTCFKYRQDTAIHTPRRHSRDPTRNSTDLLDEFPPLEIFRRLSVQRGPGRQLAEQVSHQVFYRPVTPVSPADQLASLPFGHPLVLHALSKTDLGNSFETKHDNRTMH